MALGIDEEQMQPLWHDFEEMPHPTSWATARAEVQLPALCGAHRAGRFTPQEVRIMVVDFRRAIFDSVPPEYRLGYSVSFDSTEGGRSPRSP
jgi:S-DNA-T family DNA segregation ATPase FtsK/SpoIIIE